MMMNDVIDDDDVVAVCLSVHIVNSSVSLVHLRSLSSVSILLLFYYCVHCVDYLSTCGHK